MSGVNKCLFVGFCGKDSELIYAQNGSAIMKVSLAVTETWFDSNTKEKKENTQWIPLVMFGKRAESVAKFVTKGKQIYVEGRWQTRKWQDKETGKDRYSTECIVQELQLLGGGKRSERQDDAGSNGGGGYEDHGQAGGGQYDDSDIPFLVNETSGSLFNLGKRII